MATYSKPYLTLAEQVDLLASRGMVVTDRQETARWLSVVGYYRLSGYWYPYRQLSGEPPTRSDQYIAGTTFDQVLALYHFDRYLKMHTLDALERIEVAMRFRVGYTLGKRGAYAHLGTANFDARFTRPHKDRPSTYEEWRDKLAAAQSRSKEDFVTHFEEKYDGRLPVWVASELLDFGGLSFLYDGMLRPDRDEIAAQLGVANEQGGNGRALANWMRVANYVRNVCAHHSRLWNRNLTDQVATKHLRTIPELSHLAAPGKQHENARPFAALCVIAYLLDRVDPDNTYRSDIDSLIANRLPATRRNAQEIGFPPDWASFASTR